MSVRFAIGGFLWWLLGLCEKCFCFTACLTWMWFECVQMRCHVVVYTVSCFEVKTEAGNDDAIIQCLHDDKPSIGRLCVFGS